jgi:YVTN family beta-propeller protein
MDLRPLVHPRQTVAATVLAALAGLVAPAALAQNAYITNYGSDTVSVIDTATNGYVGSPIRVGDDPFGVAVTPDGSRVYVANQSSGTVSVIDTATNAVVGPAIQIGPSSIPVAFGLFIQPAEAQFAGTPGQKNCAGQSASAVARRYGGLGAAARALGYASVAELQGAISTYCIG